MHKKILSKIQRANLSLLDPMIVGELKTNNWRNSPAPLLRCVMCGKYKITTPIIQFFNYLGERLVCYDCQNLSKSNLKSYEFNQQCSR